jgi:nucleotide-binding universal stress UspA family protein
MANRNGDGPVLFAYDGSEQAKASIHEAARQLSPGRDAIVLTVWQPLAAISLRAASAAPELEESIQADAMGVADEGARLAGSLGFRAAPVAASGTPVWQAIVTAADDRDASILMMGSHGRTGIGLVLMGSVAAAVTRHSDRPVLVVHVRA